MVIVSTSYGFGEKKEIIKIAFGVYIYTHVYTMCIYIFIYIYIFLVNGLLRGELQLSSIGKQTIGLPNPDQGSAKILHLAGYSDLFHLLPLPPPRNRRLNLSYFPTVSID